MVVAAWGGVMRRRWLWWTVGLVVVAVGVGVLVWWQFRTDDYTYRAFSDPDARFVVGSGLGAAEVYALDPGTGEVLWDRGVPEPDRWSDGARLVVADGLVVAGTRGFPSGAVALDVSDGL
jgi:outer membrane protein assembly factor BamB